MERQRGDSPYGSAPFRRKTYVTEFRKRSTERTRRTKSGALARRAPFPSNATGPHASALIETHGRKCGQLRMDRLDARKKMEKQKRNT